MKDMITAADKKRFITWFLEHYELKNPEAEWLLQYMSSNVRLLEHTHFTDQFHRAPKALFMSTTCVQMTGFKFYKNRRMTSDVEKAFLDLHNHPDEDVYITLYFRDRARCVEYAAVVETDADVVPDANATDALLQLEAEIWLDEIERAYHKDVLAKAIDAALQREDREEFMRLSKQYKTLLVSQH